MKKLEDLRPPKGSRKDEKRRGRGYSSGAGGHESGRGTKGQNSRSGGKPRVGFEGGQTPIWRRFPKRGFNNPTRKSYQWINVSALNRYEDGTELDPSRLKLDGLINGLKDGLKILGDGKLEKSLTVKAHKFSAGAKKKIEQAGGKWIEIEETE